MKIYHGSKNIIEQPSLNGSNINNDYGPAFYLTNDLESANEWACRNNTVGFVNHYELKMNNLKVLDLTDKSKWSVLNWIAILMHHRSINDSVKRSFQHRLDYLEQHYYVDISKYDVVIGYRADDAYFRFPLDFIRGNLTQEQLENVYQLGNLGIQYALISQKALDSLTFIKAESSEWKYVGKYFLRVDYATHIFDDLSKDEDGTRITDIIREK